MGVFRLLEARVYRSLRIPHAGGGVPDGKNLEFRVYGGIPHAGGGVPLISITSRLQSLSIPHAGGGGPGYKRGWLTYKVGIPHAGGGVPVYPDAKIIIATVFPTLVGVFRII